MEAARILIELMESPDELQRAGRAAKEKFLHDYAADVVVPRLLSFLEPAPRISDALRIPLSRGAHGPRYFHGCRRAATIVPSR